MKKDNMGMKSVKNKRWTEIDRTEQFILVGVLVKDLSYTTFSWKGYVLTLKGDWSSLRLPIMPTWWIDQFLKLKLQEIREIRRIDKVDRKMKVLIGRALNCNTPNLTHAEHVKREVTPKS